MIRNNPTLKPSKLRRRRRKILAVKILFVFLLIVGLIFLLSWLSKISAIQITNIKVSGNSSVSEDEIKNLITEETSKKYLLLFSQNSLFLYPRKQIEAKILNDLKKIEKVEIKSKGLKTKTVSVVERKPNSIWCDSGESEADGNNSKEKNPESCYFLDREGMVFSDAPSFSGQAYTRYHGLLQGDLNPIGRMYLPSAKFKEIGNFINSLKGLGLVISEFHSETEGDYEIYLENGSKIIFDDRRPFDKILVNLESILSEIGIGKGLSTSSSVKLDYVDLRFGNKVFYKTK